ncbi:hypothetical protein MR798_01005 [bacterium]|uniref:hypothetical protein n=1 Tax=Gemmiger sp. TaxID=2049027 RepID=UPI002A916DC6|nr:hypothetical protein [Gemmiger sp.]MCI6082615.1 hypothetical protein [bacterium]
MAKRLGIWGIAPNWIDDRNVKHPTKIMQQSKSSQPFCFLAPNAFVSGFFGRFVQIMFQRRSRINHKSMA